MLSILVPILFAGCKKTALTPDGKPQSDAQKNILRIDASAAASYWLSVAEYDSANVNLGAAGATFYQLKNDLTSSYECAFAAKPGQVVFIEVYTNGEEANCDIYYKGVKVTASAAGDIFNSHAPGAPSHVNMTYVIPN